MDNEEAKFILSAYRPNGADAGSALFYAALEQARQDPELGRWFEREQALDRSVARRVQGAAVPPGLRDAILAGAKVSIRTERAWWRQAVWLAAAASVALLLGLAFTWMKTGGRGESERFGQFAATDLVKAANHDAQGEQRSQLKAFLAQATTRLAAGLPIEIERLRADGCRVVSFAGREVVEVCFERGGNVFHLYAMRREGAADAAARFVKSGGAHAMVWSDGRFVYAVASTADRAALRALL